MEEEIKFYFINYTIFIGENYVGIAAVSAANPDKALDIFLHDSAFNGYEDKIKVTSIKQVPSSIIPNLDLEEYMRSHAIEVLKLNDIIVANGKSAFEIAVEYGFTGTEKEWLDSLKGKDGKDGLSGNINYPTFRINEGMYLIMRADAASDEDRFKVDSNGNLILII